MSKQQDNNKTIHGTRGKGKWAEQITLDDGYTLIRGYEGWGISYEVQLTHVSEQMLHQILQVCVGDQRALTGPTTSEMKKEANARLWGQAF